MKIYNSSGEVVYVVVENLSLDTSVLGLQSASPTLLPDLPDTRVGFELLGSPQLNLAWDGRNSAGQIVQSGNYVAMAELVDQNGSVTTYSAVVSVLRLPTYLVASVYNSAGELVRSLKGPEGATPDISDLNFSSEQIQVGDSIGSGSLEIRRSDGSLLLDWDGRNEQGQFVSGGVYLVKIEAVLPSETRMVVAKSIEVLRVPSKDPLEGALLAPNPLMPGDLVLLVFLKNAGSGQKISAQLYNLAGERVASADNHARHDRISWDLNGLRFSSGTYFVSLKAEGQGSHSRLLKLEIKR